MEKTKMRVGLTKADICCPWKSMIYRPPSSLLDDFVYAHITLEIKTSLVRDSLTTKSEEIS